MGRLAVFDYTTTPSSRPPASRPRSSRCWITLRPHWRSGALEALPPDVATVGIAYPSTKVEARDAAGEIWAACPNFALLPLLNVNLGSLDHLEVVYVGQAFGTGRRGGGIANLAFDTSNDAGRGRLRRKEPYKEVLLWLYRFVFHCFHSTMNGRTSLKSSERRTRSTGSWPRKRTSSGVCVFHSPRPR